MHLGLRAMDGGKALCSSHSACLRCQGVSLHLHSSPFPKHLLCDRPWIGHRQGGTRQIQSQLKGQGRRIVTGPMLGQWELKCPHSTCARR